MCISKNNIYIKKHYFMNDSILLQYLQVPESSELIKQYGRAVDIPAFGERVEVNWTPGTRVTSVGGLAYFAIFLLWKKESM